MSAIYPNFAEASLSPGVDLLGSSVKAVLIDDADYTYSEAHTFLSDVPAAARVGTTPDLTGKAVTDGTFSADNTSVESVTGDPTEILLLYIDTGVETTSRLICFLDNAGVQFTPNGGAANITWNAAGIFSFV